VFSGGCRWLCVVDTDGGGGEEKRRRVVTKRGVEAGNDRFCLCYALGISMTTTFRRTPGQIHAAHFAIPTASGTVLLFIARFAPLDGTNKSS